MSSDRMTTMLGRDAAAGRSPANRPSPPPRNNARAGRAGVSRSFEEVVGIGPIIHEAARLRTQKRASLPRAFPGDERPLAPGPQR